MSFNTTVNCWPQILGYMQIILNLYRIVFKILWNRTPQAIISRLDLKSKYHARLLYTQNKKKLFFYFYLVGT
jgi:hypothetical protein